MSDLRLLRADEGPAERRPWEAPVLSVLLFRNTAGSLQAGGQCGGGVVHTGASPAGPVGGGAFAFLTLLLSEHFPASGDRFAASCDQSKSGAHSDCFNRMRAKC